MKSSPPCELLRTSSHRHEGEDEGKHKCKGVNSPDGKIPVLGLWDVQEEGGRSTSGGKEHTKRRQEILFPEDVLWADPGSLGRDFKLLVPLLRPKPGLFFFTFLCS